MNNKYLSASKTKCEQYATFKENNDIFRIDRIQTVNKFYIVTVYKLLEDQNAYVFFNNYAISEKKYRKNNCNALFEMIKDTEFNQ